MKKIFILLTVAFAAIAIAVSCNKVDPRETLVPSGETITITATLADALTKVSLTQDTEDPDGPIKVAWGNSDKIYVIDASNSSNVSEFSIASIDSDKPYIATFTGTAVSASSFNILYGAESVAAAKAFDCSSQTQSGNASTSGLLYLALMEGVNSYENIEFSQAWAAANGNGSFKQNGAIRFRLQLPAVVTSVTSVSLTAPSAIFSGSKTLKVSFDSPVAPENGILTAFAMLPMGDAIEVSDGSFEVAVETDNSIVYSKSFSPGSVSFRPGQTNAIKLSRSGYYCDAFAGGNGVEGDPYLIACAQHMVNMHYVMQRGVTTYFKLIDDIDMTGIVWFPLNNGYPESGGTKYTGNVYDKAIDFDGNGKVISNLCTTITPSDSDEYASLFGVLMGNVRDLTITDAVITPQRKSGILAGFIGTGSYGPDHCEVSNITIKKSKLENGGSYCGILAGQSAKNNNVISNITITDCEVSTSGYAAGLVACFANSAVVSDITIQGTDVTSTGSSNTATPLADDGIAGGIAAVVKSAVDFDRCIFKDGTVTGPKNTGESPSTNARYVGGLVGYVGDVAATFDDCESNSVTLALDGDGSDNNGRYIGGAFGHLGAAVKVGEAKGCRVVDVFGTRTVTPVTYLRNWVGGFVGYNNGASIKNSSSAGELEGSGGCGGFVGYSVGGSFVNNTSSVNISGKGNIGGFVGWNETTATSFEQCSASGDVTASANNSGGFAGYVISGSTFTNCLSSGEVNSSSGYVGGFAGMVATAASTFEKCNSTSKVTATGNYVGGIVGVVDVASTVIKKCCYNGTVSGKSRVGGVLGISTKEISVTVENCCSRGALIGSSTEQRFGGIVGDLGKGGSVKNCWTDMSVTAGRVVGGIVGLACYQTWGDAIASGNTVSGCVVASSQIKAQQTGNYGSSGIIVGHTSFKNILSSSYRIGSIEYVNSNTYGNTVLDQPDCDGTNWAKGTTPCTDTGAQYQQPYHGKAAASGATVSSVARDVIGWSSDIWDFSADLPALK